MHRVEKSQLFGLCTIVNGMLKPKNLAYNPGFEYDCSWEITGSQLAVICPK